MTNPLAQDLGGVVLLPCPFCGGEAYWRNGRRGPSFYVTCKNCEVIGPVTVTLDTAITAWNTRANSAEIAGALRDAERFRWLREHVTDRFVRNNEHEPCLLLPHNVDYLSPDEIDTAIDSAMQQGGGGG